MAIETSIPARTRKLVFEAFHMDLGGKEVVVIFKVDGSEERQTFRSDPAKWVATLTSLFDNLTNAAEFKIRIQTWLLDNGKVTGIVVPD